MSSALYAYTITAHVRRDPDHELHLNHLHGDGAGGDILDGLGDVLDQGAEYPPAPEDGHEDTRDRISEVESIVTPQDFPRRRYGRIRVTKKAMRYDLEHSQEGRIQVTEEDREGRPLFFWLEAPEDAPAALVFTERRSRFGIVNSFWRKFVLRRLTDTFSDATLDFAYYIPHPVWEEYRQRGEGVEGALLRKVMVETDESKELDDPSRRRTVGSITTEIDRSVAPLRERFAGILERGDREEAMELLLPQGEEIEGLDEFEDVKMRINLGDATRTVRLGNERFNQIGYPVPDDIGTDDEGFPIAAEMATFASNMASDIGGPLGIS